MNFLRTNRFATVVVFALACAVAVSGQSQHSHKKKAATNPFAGKWTYRSFRNSPEPVGDVDHDSSKLVKLLFAEAEWAVENSPGDTFKAELRFGPQDVMDLRGTITPATKTCPVRVHIIGQGRPGTSTEKLFYDYEGSLVPLWPNGIDQRRAIVGSVIRVKPHDNAPAGYVASFIAVKQD
jgi:hypothetical protein